MTSEPITLPRAPVTRESVAGRVQQLQAEAKRLASEHVGLFVDEMTALAQLAAQIAEGGDAYATGAREVARSLAEDLDTRIQTLSAIAARAS